MTALFRTYDPKTDHEATNRLWQRVFPNPRGGQNIDWLFRDGPGGIAPRAVVEIDGEIVGHAGAAPLRFRVNGKESLAGYSIAAMTDAAVRGRGLYVQLSRYLYEQMGRSGYAFVAGFSNRNSHRLMVQQLGRIPIRPFPWCVRILRPLSLVRNLVGGREESEPPIAFTETSSQGVHMAPCDNADIRFDEIWRRARDSISIGAIRDTQFMRWRFGAHPSAKYHCLVAESKGHPVVYAICRTLGFRGIPAGFIVDFLVTPGEEAAGQVLLSYIARTARDNGIALLSALMPPKSPAHTALERAGFFQVPERLHPQTIRFSVLDLLLQGGHSELYDRENWFLSWADTDIV